MDDYSIVEIFGGAIEAHRCGYCKSKGSLSYGMWAHNLTVRDYQTLIDRGWRRSGKYCYKPVMNETCCPLYPIKCDVPEFKLSKSHKKILRRMQRFLRFGETKVEKKNEMDAKDQNSSTQNVQQEPLDVLLHMQKKASTAEENIGDKRIEKRFNSNSHKPEVPTPLLDSASTGDHTPGICCTTNSANDGSRATAKQPTLGKGRDLKRPQCKKAKLMRMERKLEKMAKRPKEMADSLHVSPRKSGQENEAKTLLDHLLEALPLDAAHKLEIKLVRSEPPSAEYRQTFDESYEVYKLYQMTIHNDEADRCSSAQFTRFLVNSPLEPVEASPSSHPGYGSFHQQYWLDGNLIAVGVIDILPFCVSSVYFYYNPKYSFLSLGTYGALREIAFTQQLNKLVPALRYYYMGYYVNSCQKMRYKGQYNPSMLLCPESYTWHPIERAVEKLKEKKYCRFEETDLDDADGKVDLNDVMVLHRRTALPYYIYLSLKHKEDPREPEEVLTFAKLVGKRCAASLLLYRK